MTSLPRWRMATRFLAHRFRALHPFEVQAVLVTRCNLKCVYCRCPEIQSDEMSTEQWIRVFRGLGRLGTMRIKFQGGEPTLRSDFGQLCDEVRRRRMIASVVTNGLRIAEQPELLDHLDEMVISLDAVDASIHDRLRGAGSHERVLRAIDHAIQHRVPSYVVMVVTRLNYHELEAMVEFCEDRDLKINAQPAVFGRSYFDDSGREFALDAEQIRQLHLRIADWKRRGRPLMFSAATYAQAAAWPDFEKLSTRSSRRSSCMAGRFYAHIDPDGDLSPCQQHDSELQPKNVVRDGLEEALHHARRHHCGDCFATYLNERKALFALRPRALLEVLRRS